ncbi:MAG: sigma-70 family RNA polymerase sigma factor [Pirellulales bacterium]
MSDGETELLRALESARGGDTQALGQLLDAHREYLQLLARIQIGRRLQSKADPVDVVQDAFLDAHRQMPRFRGETLEEFAAWLRKILAGHLAQLVRKYLGSGARDVRLELSIEQELESSSNRVGLAGDCTTPSEALRQHEEQTLLARMIEQLPADYRDVLVLRQIEGLPFAEIAQRMERSVDSIQKLWVRGLQKLRELMRETA